MTNLNSFSDYVKYYRSLQNLNQVQLADKLEVSYAFITNIENKGQQFSESNLEKFSQLFGLDETEFAELLLQRAIDQYAPGKGKKTLKNLKKMLPIYKKILEGDFEGTSFKEFDYTPSTQDIIAEIRALVNKIPDGPVQNFLKTDLDYAVQKFGISG